MVKDHNRIIHIIFLVAVLTAYQNLQGMNNPYPAERAEPSREEIKPEFYMERVLKNISLAFENKNSRPKIAEKIQQHRNNFYSFLNSYFPLIIPTVFSSLNNKQLFIDTIRNNLLNYTSPNSVENKKNIPDDTERDQYFTPLHTIINSWKNEKTAPNALCSMSNYFPDTQFNNLKYSYIFYENEDSNNLLKESPLFKKIYNHEDTLVMVCPLPVFSSIISYITKKNQRDSELTKFIEKYKDDVQALIHFSSVLKRFNCITAQALDKVYIAIIHSKNFSYGTLEPLLEAPSKDHFQTEISQLKEGLLTIHHDLLRTLFQEIITQKQLGIPLFKEVMHRYPSFQVLCDTKFQNDLSIKQSRYAHFTPLLELLLNNPTFIANLNPLKPAVSQEPQPHREIKPYFFSWFSQKAKSLKNYIATNIPFISAGLAVISVAGVAAYEAYMNSKRKNQTLTDSFNKSKPLFTQRSFF